MASVAAGTIVGGKYRLEEPIGQGGMASVWRALHLTLESSVAVKFLDTYGLAREKMAKRFKREAKLAANLKHRNVVQILDYGMLEDGQPFMVMELLSGKSLADRMAGDDRPGALELLEVMVQILSGLAAVHDAGIVHRDVKPDNIFLVRDADGDYPKLLDFGISRGIDTSDEGSRMTHTGAVVGTPLYMSPEQARGIRDLDTRTDLWSVGMVLYEGLAGFCPFESENMGDTLIRVATEEPPDLTEVCPDLPPSVADAVMKALEKDREQRWSDARELRAALLAAADDVAQQGIGAARPSRRLPSQRISAVTPKADTAIDPSAFEDPAPPEPAPSLEALPSRRLPLAWIGAGAVVLLVAGGVVLGAQLGGGHEEAEPAPTAAEPRVDEEIAPPPADLAPAAPETPSVASERPAAPPAVPPDEAAGATPAPEAEPGPERDEPVRRAARRAGRRSGGAAEPRRDRSAEAPAPAVEEPRRPRPSAGSEDGTFLRDLDY